MEPEKQAPVPYAPPATFTLKGYKPWVVTGAALVAIVLFCGLNTEATPVTWESYARWGAPSSVDILNGAYWGLISSNFVHLAFWHLGFNLYWFWILGRKIEFEQGAGFMAVLLLTAAFVSSTAEFALGQSTGMGLSGVVYAFFGFIFTSGLTNSRYAGFLVSKLVWQFVGWLFFCLLLTATNVWQVGNAAHFAGLAWGAAVAWLYQRRKAVRYGLGILVLAGLSVPLFWAPWSVLWLSNKAYTAHTANDVPMARHYYRLILQKEPANQFALSNLNFLRIDELSKQAELAFKQQQIPKAQQLCRQILKLQPANEWALAMLSASAGSPVQQ
ncbi:rhomboid family intramembrane serine protease [Hymenobacter properus]|uniref:Rhomboid family intramembrane serine protease n=1 Tax=Hymenobacter properus TaxID=2791026 RepID=A0A931FPR9_9BACT|nr:rhomboid family intramembrane serine protease [Hymenobacter properus]MBF9143894.1 rhomboid family intramembrane serine protease [Hymenobacter properus]MBR7722708.1 rhomboid family intramembrane serine protease [Microvirga sp. SRT04]